jgi:hypothetical protein
MVNESDALYGDRALRTAKMRRSSLEPRTADRPYATLFFGEKNAPKIVLLTRLAEHRRSPEVEFFGFTDLLVVSDAVGLSDRAANQDYLTDPIANHGQVSVSEGAVTSLRVSCGQRSCFVISSNQ